MRIVELDLSDDDTAHAVHAVGLRSYRVEAEIIGFDGIPALHETPAQTRARPLRWLGVGDPVVAFVGFTESAGGVDVDRLCVDPDWFRRGLARALLTAVLAATSGPVEVHTGAANTPAIALYESAGFVRTATIDVPGTQLARLRLERG
ncbi:GNAT family N-acetyltransferase [Actinokineospora pegani]|uniref:GNAT family N-acetyltransferase n=1 Tax=Actinokineospora pegani TaxID=2654637 RepID=UPI0012EA1D72|nr:GNAT family N-acetyltransferase [Actinokineospora pegani]